MFLKEKIIKIAKLLKTELQLYKNIYRDKRTPLLAKICFGAAIGYFLSPIDIIPDFIPIIGHLDDALLVPLLIYLAIRLTPIELVDEHRNLLKKTI